MCRVGRATLSTAAIAQLNRLVRDRDVAYSALFARVSEAGAARVTRREILAAEAAVVAVRFAGSRSRYVAALARARANVEIARAILADELRRRKLGARIRAPRPSAAAIGEFYGAYGDLLVRWVEADDAQWWLGRRRAGLAIESFAPPQLFTLATGRRASVRTLLGRIGVRVRSDARPLSSLPLTAARPAIATVLAASARSDAVVRWSAARQSALLDQTTCRKDDLPTVAAVDLTAYLPFLSLPA